MVTFSGVKKILFDGFEDTLKRSFFKERKLCAEVSRYVQKKLIDCIVITEYPYYEDSGNSTRSDIYICDEEEKQIKLWVEVKIFYYDGALHKDVRNFPLYVEKDIIKWETLEANRVEKFILIAVFEEAKLNLNEKELSDWPAQGGFDNKEAFSQIVRKFNEIMGKWKITLKIDKREVSTKEYEHLTVCMFYAAK